MVFSHRIIFSSLSFFYLLLSFGSSQAEYDISTLNRLSVAVAQYINTSTQEVCQRAGTETDLAQSFEKEFLEDNAYPEDEISEEKRNNRCMHVVKQILFKEDSSAEKLNALEFKENNAIYLHNKEIALIAAHDSYWMKKLGLRVVTSMGAIILLSATSSIIPKDAKLPIGTVGGLIATSGAIGLYSISGEQQRLQTHINQIHTMKTNWQFKLKKR